LGRFAERIGGVILHERRENHHHYYVQEGEITYHYQTAVQDLEDIQRSNKADKVIAASDEGAVDLESEDEEGSTIQDVVEDNSSKKKEGRGWQETFVKFIRKTRFFFRSIRRWIATLRGKEGGLDEDA
jgi:hypothetical protein